MPSLSDILGGAKPRPPVSYTGRVTIVWVGTDGQSYNVSLDATLAQSHTSSNTVTEHPVEDGANMSDHIRPDLDTLSLEGIISNTPVVLPADNTDGARIIDVEIEGVASSIRIPLPIVGALVGGIPTSPTPKGVVTGFEPVFDRIGACYAALLRLRNEGTLCSVLTHVREYESMAIRQLGVTLDSSTGHALPLSLEFVQVRIGSTEEVPVPVIPTQRQDKGAVTPEAPSDPVGENTSLLYNAVRG